MSDWGKAKIAIIKLVPSEDGSSSYSLHRSLIQGREEGVKITPFQVPLDLASSSSSSSSDAAATDFLHVRVKISLPFRIEVPADAGYISFEKVVRAAVDDLLVHHTDETLLALSSSSASFSDMILTHAMAYNGTVDPLEDVDSIWEYVVDSVSASAADDGFGVAGAEMKKKKKKKSAKKSASAPSGAKPSITLDVMECVTGPSALSRVPPHR